MLTIAPALQRGRCRAPRWIRAALAQFVTTAAIAAPAGAAGCISGTWIPLTIPSRAYTALAYDSARHVAVAFGGTGGGAVLGDTWEWNGDDWAERRVDGPSARWGHAMSFDSAHGCALLFGGSAGFNITPALGDTWRYDGASWTRVATTGPSARTGAAMCFDAARGVAVLFGGRAGAVLGDTWEWDGSAWTQRAVAGPPARWGGAMAYDAARGRVVLFGGAADLQGAGPLLADTWEWDGASWTSQNAVGPVARVGAAAAYDPDLGGVVLFGGVGAYSVFPQTSLYGDTWVWDGASWTERAEPGPSGRGFAGMAYAAEAGGLVLFGGEAGNTRPSIGETWARSASAWERVRVSGPPLKYSSVGVYDSRRDRIVVYGVGIDGVAETWEWDGTHWAQRDVVSPPARSRAALAFDPRRARTVLFGGVVNAYSHFGDTWEWDGDTWRQIDVPGPSARQQAVMSYNTPEERILLFGGRRSIQTSGGGAGNEAYADTWAWDGSAWSQLPDSGPPVGPATAMVYETARNTVLLVCGWPSQTGSAWEWAGTWQQRAAPPSAASLGADGALAYDDQRATALLLKDGPYADWDGAAWRTVARTATPGASAAVYESSRGRIIGYRAAEDTYMWSYDPPCPADVNCDRAANAIDLSQLLSAWGTADPAADLNADGVVNAYDLGLLLGGWGACPN